MQSGKRPAVTYLTPVRPSAGVNGLAMRAGRFLEALARHHDVHLVILPLVASPSALADDDTIERFATSTLTLELEDPAEASHWPTALLATAAGRQRATELYPLPAYCRRPTAAAAEQLTALAQGSALVHVMRSYLAPLVDFLIDAELRPALTLDLDDLDSDVHRQSGYEQEGDRFERLERYYIPRFDQVYAASWRAPEIIRERYGASGVVCVPNAAVKAPIAVSAPHTDAAGDPAGRPSDGYDLLFVGNLFYAPNVDAVRWLCLEILPLLPGATLAIVGSQPAEGVIELAQRPGVTLAPDVPDVSSWYQQARLVVAPLRTGAGTPTKIAEAGAHGRAVVATRHAVSGLAPGTGGFELADTAADFARACRRLLDDPELAARLAASGAASHPTADQVTAQIDTLTRRLTGA